MFGQDFQHYVQDYGYFGVFGVLMLGIIGMPVPDETTLVFIGYLVHKGHLPIVQTYMAAWAGTMSGITISYLLGRYVGCRLLVKYGRFFHVTQERLDRVEKWFEHRGKWLLTAGYFVPGVRHLFAIVAGSSRLPFHIFALFSYAGGLIWTSSFITLGYLFGETWEKAARETDIIVYAASGATVAVIVVFFVGRYYLLKAKRERGN